MGIQENPMRFNFTWDWDWSSGEYTIYRKSPEEPNWGDPIAILPWGEISFTDENVEQGIPYEYAFYKKEFDTIVTTIDVPVNETLIFSFENVFGDGLCCNFGFGWYEAEVCGEIVLQGSDFGFIQSDTFTVCDFGNETEQLTLSILPDMMVNNSWWSLEDTAGVQIASSGTPGTWLDDRPKYGYILAGKALPRTEYRGSILILVDDVYSVPLQDEIAGLERDLVADGWRVIREEVNREYPMSQVKALIINVYKAVDDLKMVYLLGHIPVPYSGSIYPDGHVENHWGAWPADVYYGDLDGVFSDTLVNNISAQFASNHNIPGDGKFDQSAISSSVELAIGRVDFYNMPAFGIGDVELTRRYLEKAHLFKTGQREATRRALVDDNLNIVLGSPAASGWRNFAPMFTADSVQALDYFSTMKNESYLWSYGCGSGTHQSANGIGTTTDFVNDTLKNIFTMLLGSQFGDWDNKDNFLRAPLASSSWTLASCWAGNPPFVFHKMAMGEPIGYSLLATQNASSVDYYPGPALIHTSLMGDPTLRLHPVKIPSDLNLHATGESVELNWQAPENEDVIGYSVYRKDSLSYEFVLLNANPALNTFYIDIQPPEGTHTYMVRALKLETSGSGTYFNLSLGVIDTVSYQYISGVENEDASSLVSVFPNPSSGEVFLDFPIEWGVLKIEVFDVEGKVVLERKMTSGILDLSNFGRGVYFIRVHAKKNEISKFIKLD